MVVSVSPIPSPVASPAPSPVPSPALPVAVPVQSLAQFTDTNLADDETGFSGGLDGAEDGGSGVGFFELDEELASPGLREGVSADTFDLDNNDEEPKAKEGPAKDGLGIAPTVTVGSLPINIIRSGSSFMGTYGH